MGEHFALKHEYDNQEYDADLAANDPHMGEVANESIDALPTNKLLERKKALLWLAHPDNGQSKELRGKSEAMIEQIDALLAERA